MTNKSLIASLCLGVCLFACQPSDSALQKEVNEKLSLVPGITAEVKNGIVILSGEVSDEVAKSAAEDALRGVRGIKSVQDNITVKAPLPAASPPQTAAVADPDQLLKKKLDAVYAANGFTDITVTISAGEITLDGTAKKKQLRKVVRLAQQASDKKVVSHVKGK